MRSAARCAGHDGAFLAFQGDGDRAQPVGTRPVRRRQYPGRRRAAGSRQVRRDCLERHLGELAWLRARRGAGRADRGGDRHPRRHLRARLSRPVRQARRQAHRPRHAIYRRRPGADHEQLGRGRFPMRGRTAMQACRRTSPFRPYEEATHRARCRAGGAKTASGSDPMHQHARRRGRGETWSANSAFPFSNSVAVTLWASLAAIGADIDAAQALGSAVLSLTRGPVFSSAAAPWLPRRRNSCRCRSPSPCRRRPRR